MDMQIGVFCGLFSVIASLVVYAVLSVNSYKEDSFDEARANRRKLFKEYQDQRASTDKSKSKKPKKVAKKGKDKKSEQLEEDSEKKEIVLTEVAKEVFINFIFYIVVRLGIEECGLFIGFMWSNSRNWSVTGKGFEPHFLLEHPD